MSLLLTPYVEFFMLSLTSLLNTDRFWVNLHTHTHTQPHRDRQVCEERQVGQKQSGASCLLNNLWQSTDELILFIFSFNVLIKMH